MPLFPPLIVEDGIYRSALPNELNYSFLHTLKLKTIVVMSAQEQSLNGHFNSFVDDYNINCIFIENVVPEQRGGIRSMCLVSLWFIDRIGTLFT